MSNSVIAAQLYTLRDYLKTPEQIAETLKKVREIGYEAVQVSGMGPIEPEALKEITDREGLKICATHISFDQLFKETDAVIREHKLWGCKYVGLGAMPNEYRNKEGYKKFAKEASDVARVLKDNGLQFIYHNHNFEFRKFDGVTGMEMLFNETDPEVFQFEIDTYWVQAGGADPMAWIKKMDGRMSVIHYKDMVMGENGPIMAEVGEGNLNWPEIIKVSKSIGVEWYAVEQDVCQRSPFESLAMSFKNLKSLGLE